MTAGNNGADTPENDDPFAYLYRSEGGEGSAQGSPGAGAQQPRQPGVPRTSYNHVRAVGERQYGGAQPPQQQNAHYAAPETFQGQGGGDRTRPVPTPAPQAPRRNHKGLLIGAVAVVLVVCAGIGVAIFTNSNDTKTPEAKPEPSTSTENKPSNSPSTKPSPNAPLPKQDAAALQLSPDASTDTAVKGAKASNGAYVSLNKVGAAATWSVDVPKAGAYTLLVAYGVPGKDAKTSLTVNDGKPDEINMANFSKQPEGDWEKGWQNTWRWINLNKGTNTIKISCEQGNQCEVNLDQVSLKSGHVRR